MIVMLLAPTGQDFALLLASGCASWDSFDVLDPQRSKLSGGNGSPILIGNTPAKKLAIGEAGGVRKDGNTVRHATVHQVRRLQRARATSVDGHDNNVSRFYRRFVGDEQMPGRP